MGDIPSRPHRIAASGGAGAAETVTSQPAILTGYTIHSDNSNDPTVTIYNDTDALTAANQVLPPTTFEATNKGIEGVVDDPIICENGIHVVIACSGTAYAMIRWRRKGIEVEY